MGLRRCKVCGNQFSDVALHRLTLQDGNAMPFKVELDICQSCITQLGGLEEGTQLTLVNFD